LFRALSSVPISEAYQDRITSGVIRRDEKQILLASRLDALHNSLASTDSSAQNSGLLKVDRELSRYLIPNPLEYASAFAKRALLKQWMQIFRPTPKGLYIHGSVGVGKSFLMDLFYDACGEGNTTLNRKRRRAHFHEFMLDVHQRIHKFKQKHPKEDPIPPIALELAKESQLLCFDEFQVTDIADAMIMKRLFSILFELGVVLVSTSNRAPELLYDGGLNRDQFLPFIDLLREHCDTIEMDAIHDYRKDNLLPQIPYSYFYPSGSDETRVALERVFQDSSSDETRQTTRRNETLPVMMGRTVEVPRANAVCAWFDFYELCAKPLGAADYLSISARFPIIIVENVPQLGASHYNEARRFVTLIDTLYESRTRLVIAAAVPMDELFIEFEADVTTNDGDEETALPDGFNTTKTSKELKHNENNENGGPKEMWVSGKGGSSSSMSTTMIKTKDGNMEWSATGRIGVSLAQLSAVRDTTFSFRRAQSRLFEMSNVEWGRS